MRHYLTSCDAGYLPRLKVLHASMVRHCGPFRLHVLALGPEVAEWGSAQPDVEVMPTIGLVALFPQIAVSALPGPPRLKVDEQLCTWRWWYAVALLKYEHAESVTCIDADAMFWGSPEELLAGLDAQHEPIGVVPHAIPRRAEGFPGIAVEDHGHFGLFNGGFVYLGDVAAAETLAEYVRQWCYAGWRDHPGGRKTYGDQGYLELVVEQHGGAVIDDPRFITAPWNLHLHKLTKLDDGGVLTDGLPLVWFHYLGYRHDARTWFSYATTDEHDRILYVPYRAALLAAGG